MTLINANQLSTSPLQYTVEGMMPKGAGWVYGSPYVGKSFLIGIELCLAVANGLPFLGRETEQGTALWALAEGLDDAGLRVKGRLIREQHDRKMLAAQIARLNGQAAADAWLAAQPPYTDDNFRIEDDGFTIPFTAGTPGQPTEELRVKAAELSMIEDLRLIVLDTAQLFTDLSIDNPTTSKRFMKGMKWLSRQLGCTVVGITHPVPKGHGETGLPGTQLKALAEFVWQVQADPDSTDDEPRSVIIAEKIKSSALFRPITYRLEEIHWKQPPVDPETEEELDVPEDEYETVGSVTVRLCENKQPDRSPAQAPVRPRQLPEAIPAPAETTRKRIRTGVRPQIAFRPAMPALPAAPAAASPAPAAQDTIRELLAGQCPDCRRGNGIGCDLTRAGSSEVITIGRTPSGPLYAHEKRIMTAALADSNPEEFMDRAIAGLTAAGAPA